MILLAWLVIIVVVIVGLLTSGMLKVEIDFDEEDKDQPSDERKK